MEVFEMLPEGTLAELINDRIFMSPSPLYAHQKTSMELLFSILKFIKKNDLGICLAAPIDIFFDEKNVLQPDIVFIANENLSIIKDNKIQGSPDLIVEILSEGNKDHDHETKKEVYEKFGIREYFIVDPETKETLTYYLQNKKFEKQSSQNRIITSKFLNNSFSF